MTPAPSSGIILTNSNLPTNIHKSTFGFEDNNKTSLSSLFANNKPLYKIQKNDVVERLVIDPTLTPDLPVPDTTRSPTIEQRETSSEEDSIQFIEDNPSRAVNVLKISRKKSLDSLQQTPTPTEGDLV